MTLGQFSVRNPVLINLVMILALVAGFFSISRLPQEQFSEIPFYYVNISVPYPGVSPEDIEQSITIKVENEMSGLDRLDEIQSVTTEGVARITLQFDQGLTDNEFDSIYQEVQSRVNNLELPTGALQPTVDDFSTNDFLPVVEVIISGFIPYRELTRQADDLRDELLTVPEVSGINQIGARDRQITVEVQRERLEALGIALNEVVTAIRTQNVSVPGGTLDTGSREFLLRTTGQLESADQFRDIVIRRSGDAGSGVVTVGDVARVEDGFDLDGTAARFNGRPAISLQVTKVPGGSSIGILDEVKRRVAELEPGLPEGVRVDYFNDSTVQIRDSIDVLVSNAILGLALLVVILLIFVGIRNAIITAVGIPLTFALTFVVLEAFGETLNSNTLFGLVLVLGLIVDHAIVIVENSFRLQQQQGLSRHEAAVQGVDQVIVPVVAATLTTIAAFLPLTFLPGVIGKFLRVVPLTVSIALVISTLEAGIILPSHYADWPGGNRKRERRRPHFFQGFQDRFGTVLGTLYRRRGIVAIGAVLVLAGIFSAIGTIQQDLFNAEDFTVYYIDIEMPPGTTVDKTDRIVREYENRLLPLVGNGEVVAVNAFVGFTGSDTENVRRSNIGQLVVDLTEKDQGRTRSISEIMAEAETATRDIPGPEQVQFRKQQSGPPTDPPVAFRLFGDRFDELAGVARAIKDELRQYPELVNIDDDLDRGTPELRLRVDEDRAVDLGLSSQTVGQFIRTSFDGVIAGTVFTDNQETNVLVRYSEDRPRSIESILQLKIPTPDGRQIAFSTVASIEEASAISSIRRIDGKREVTVSAEAVTEENVPAVNAAVEELYQNELRAQYPGVVLNVGGEFAELEDTLVQILRVFVIGVMLIYAILATQFNSYTQPILVILTVPFAFAGVVLFLLISGTPLSTVVIYASVALAGIAVNDTIVLVTFANEKRKEGMPVAEAVLDAATNRLRPIILTSLTTVAGLIPTALGIGGESVVWGPMASTIIFGLLFSTLTSLIIVPSFYGLFYDSADKEIRNERRRRRRMEKRSRKLGSSNRNGESSEVGA